MKKHEKINILIVEDEAILAQQTKRMLEKLGYHVPHIFDRAEQVIKYIRQESPDLVLMDIKLKGKTDGIDAARKINMFSDVPIIFLTAYADNQTLDRVKVLEPYGYLIKPFRQEELRSTIEITSYKYQAQKLIQEREAQYYDLFEQSNDAILIFDLAGEIRDVNQNASDLLGYAKEELRGMTLFDIYPESEKKRAREALKIVKTNGYARYESLFRRKDGRLIDMEINSSGVDITRGLIQIIARNISERKKNEALLNKLTAAIEQSPAHIIITDKSGNIEYVNPKFSQVTEYTREEVLGENPRLLQSGQTPRETYQQMWKTVLSGKTWQGDFVNRKKSGGHFWEQALIGPIMTDGRITHLIGIKTDTTYQRQIEEEKKKLECELRRSSRLETIGTLAGGIAHDFNNILTPMIVYAEMALDDVPADSRTHSDLRHVLKGIERAKNLIEQILTFSRQSEQNFKPLLLQTIVNEVLHLIRVSLPATIEIHQDIDSQCQPVLADATQIHQVLMNLCANAKQVMPEGGKLSISLKHVCFTNEQAEKQPNLKAGDYVRLSVGDTGYGMDPGMLNHIFDPFYTSREDGTGLGLSVVHGIIKSHEGEIVVESEPNKGTIFHIYLPVSLQTTTMKHNKQGNEIFSGKGTLLFVDDQHENREMGRDLLERAGYTVLTAVDGREALNHFTQSVASVDLVITDLVMPGMTGEELARQLHHLKPDLPIILLTGYGETQEEYLFDSSQFDLILKKPPDRKNLCKAVLNLMKVHQQ